MAAQILASRNEIIVTVTRTFQPEPYKSFNMGLTVTKEVSEAQLEEVVAHDTVMRLDHIIEELYRKIKDKRGGNW